METENVVIHSVFSILSITDYRKINFNKIKTIMHFNHKIQMMLAAYSFSFIMDLAFVFHSVLSNSFP